MEMLAGPHLHFSSLAPLIPQDAYMWVALGVCQLSVYSRVA
jgi:hypothetical protein